MITESLDFGGPRKEFFTIFLREMAELLIESGTLKYSESHLDMQYYYYFGLVTG